MSGYRSVTPSINVNTESGQLRTELLNTFSRLDGQLSLAPFRQFAFIGPVLTSGALETTLLTTTLDVNTLPKQFSSILLFACGNTAANGNNKTINLYFGSTQIFTTGAFAGNNVSWTLESEIVRNGAAAQVVWTKFQASATLTSMVGVSSPTEDLSTAKTISLKGLGTSSGDVSALYWKGLFIT